MSNTIQDAPGFLEMPVGVYVGPYAENMTLRDHFAAKAMQVVLYQCDCFPDEDWRVGVAMDSYAMADAMLKARQK